MRTTFYTNSVIPGCAVRRVVVSLLEAGGTLLRALGWQAV